MASQQYYYDLIKKQNQEQKDKDIADIKAQTEAQKQIITENTNAQIAETNQAYDNLQRKNELQRELNKRFFERKAAETGRTNTGFNLTQQTAAQLSAANQSAEYDRQNQKAVDTLALTMRSKITELETNQNSQINAIEKSYDQFATEQATQLYKSQFSGSGGGSANYSKGVDEPYKFVRPPQFLIEMMSSNDITSEQKYNRLKLEYEMGTLDDEQMAYLIELSNMTDSRVESAIPFLLRPVARIASGIKRGVKKISG